MTTTTPGDDVIEGFTPWLPAPLAAQVTGTLLEQVDLEDLLFADFSRERKWPAEEYENLAQILTPRGVVRVKVNLVEDRSSTDAVEYVIEHHVMRVRAVHWNTPEAGKNTTRPSTTPGVVIQYAKDDPAMRAPAFLFGAASRVTPSKAPKAFSRGDLNRAIKQVLRG